MKKTIPKRQGKIIPNGVSNEGVLVCIARGLALFFVRSGDVIISLGQFRGAGNVGYDWSSRVAPDTQAYFLGFTTSTNMIPSGNNNRYNAFPLRCLSTV